MTAISQNATFINAASRFCLRLSGHRTLRLAFVAACVCPCLARAQGSREDYSRWESYSKRTANRVFRHNIKPNWIGDHNDSFWYRVQIDSNAHQFILVDAAAKRRRLAFDHEAVAKELDAHSSMEVNADRMDLRSLTFDAKLTQCQFRFGGQAWTYQLPSGPLDRLAASSEDGAGHAGVQAETTIVTSIDSAQQANIVFVNQTEESLQLFWIDQGGKRHSYGKISPGKERESSSYVGHAWVLLDQSDDAVAAFVVDAWRKRAVIDHKTPRPKPATRRTGRRKSRATSPDKKWTVSFIDHNVSLVENGTSSIRVLSDDGRKGNSYGDRVWWSPDSRHFVVMKTREAKERQISMVESAPNDSIHGKLKTIDYVKPGDELDLSRVALFHVNGDSPALIDNASFDNPFGLTDLAWHENSKSFSFLYNQRGHQALRLIRVDAETAQPKTIIDETSKTFVCYSHKKFLRRLDETE